MGSWKLPGRQTSSRQTQLKYCKNDFAKNRVEETLPSYVDRLEQVSAIIKNGGKVPAPKKAAAATGGGGGDDKKEEENEMMSTMVKPENMTGMPSWSDVAGLEDAKALLYESVILPQRLPHLY